jgi:hypothetical protein
MNIVQNGELGRILSRHYHLNNSNPVPTISSEAIPVILMEDFRKAHPSDVEVNRCTYDGLQATVAAGDIACTFELFNPPNSGIFAELVSWFGGCTYHTDISMHICTAQNPGGTAIGTGKFLHLGTPNTISAGNAALSDRVDTNRLAQTNQGGGFIRIARVPADGMAELMVPGCPIFIVPGTGVRMQVKGGTAGTAYWCGAWIERRVSNVG